MCLFRVNREFMLNICISRKFQHGALGTEATSVRFNLPQRFKGLPRRLPVNYLSLLGEVGPLQSSGIAG